MVPQFQVIIIPSDDGQPDLGADAGRTHPVGVAVLPRGDRNLWFGYTVQADDSDPDGIAIVAGALALNGDRIRNTAGADATLGLGGHAVINDSGHRVDGGG